LAKKAIFPHFPGFWALGGPWETPREPGFYINPSRRGPAVPAGGPGDRGPTPVPEGQGEAPIGAPGDPPPGEAQPPSSGRSRVPADYPV